MSKKEIGLAVRAVAHYASDCFGNGDYIGMRDAFDIARQMANMYELKEAEWVGNIACTYINEALKELQHDIEQGETAKELYDILTD